MCKSTEVTTNKVLKLLGIGSEIKMNNVFKHFNELLEWFKSCSQDEISAEMLKFTNDITMSVYQYLCKKLNSTKDNSTMNDNDLLQYLELLRDKECVWNGKIYLLPNHVSFNWQTGGPYLYRFPEILQPYVSLMKNLGIKEDFPCNVLINALYEMKDSLETIVFQTTVVKWYDSLYQNLKMFLKTLI